MDISNWKVLKKVAEYANITTASEELNISQSGVSYIIKSIENEIGFSLFVRHKKGVTLTPVGKDLLPLVDQLLESEKKLTQAFTQINELSRGTLHIGSFSSFATNWLPEIIKEFHKDYPNIKIELLQGASDDIEKALLGQEIDFAFTSYRDRSGFEWIELIKDYLVAVLPENHELSSLEKIPLRIYEETPVISSSNQYEYDVSHALSKHHIVPKNIVFKSNDESTIIAMVRKNLGLSLLFSEIVKSINSKHVLIKKTEPLEYRKLGVAIQAQESASPAAKMFIKYAVEITNKSKK